MKKVFIVLAVLLCSVAVFAADNSFNFSATPYTVQFVTSSAAKETGTSSYGVGAELTYKRNIWNGIYAEAGYGWDTFIYANKEVKAYTNVIFFAGVGYKYDFDAKWNAEIHYDAACDAAFYAGEAGDAVTIRTGLGVGYNVTDKLTATFKVDGTFGFASKDGANYVRYRVIPMIGCSYNF